MFTFGETGEATLTVVDENRGLTSDARNEDEEFRVEPHGPQPDEAARLPAVRDERRQLG